MIRKLIAVLVFLAFGYGVVALFNYYKRVETQVDSGAASQFTQAPVEVASESLPGLPQQYEGALKAAKDQGAEAMGKWLRAYGPYIRDPRKAAIELDYAAMLVRTDPAQAKKIFQGVQKRIPADSPLFPRIQRLEPGYK